MRCDDRTAKMERKTQRTINSYPIKMRFVSRFRQKPVNHNRSCDCACSRNSSGAVFWSIYYLPAMSSSLHERWRTNWNIGAARNSECSGLNFVALPSSSHVACSSGYCPTLNAYAELRIDGKWKLDERPKVHVSITRHSSSFFSREIPRNSTFSRNFFSFLLKLVSGNSASFMSKLLSLMSKSYENSLEDIEKLSDAEVISFPSVLYRKEENQKKKMKFNCI